MVRQNKTNNWYSPCSSAKPPFCPPLLFLRQFPALDFLHGPFHFPGAKGPFYPLKNRAVSGLMMKPHTVSPKAVDSRTVGMKDSAICKISWPVVKPRAFMMP